MRRLRTRFPYAVRRAEAAAASCRQNDRGSARLGSATCYADPALPSADYKWAAAQPPPEIDAFGSSLDLLCRACDIAASAFVHSGIPGIGGFPGSFGSHAPVFGDPYGDPEQTVRNQLDGAYGKIERVEMSDVVKKSPSAYPQFFHFECIARVTFKDSFGNHPVYDFHLYQGPPANHGDGFWIINGTDGPLDTVTSVTSN